MVALFRVVGIESNPGLAPIAGTRLMVPYRASIPTPIGMGVLQASQFVSIPRPPVPTASNLKMQ